MIDVGKELASASAASCLMHYRRLLKLGVSTETAASLRGPDGLGWGVARVTVDDEGLYRPGQGEQHLILPVGLDGMILDLVAFRSATPDTWLLRTGLGWALGVHGGLERYTWGRPALLHETPLDWLRAGMVGLCVLDWDAPELQYLKTLPEIVCASDRLAETLGARLRRDPHFPNITAMTAPGGASREAA